MPEAMLALGDYRFALDTAAYQQFERQATYNWPEQARMGNAPALQFTGRGGETIHLSGIIYPFYKGGLDQVQSMRAMAGKGKPLQLVSGVGDNLGRWVIVSVEERDSEFFFAGVPKKIEFNLTLRRYAEVNADTNFALAIENFYRGLVREKTLTSAPTLAPQMIPEIRLADIPNLTSAFQHAGVPPREGVGMLNKLAMVLANAQYQSQAWKDAVGQVGLTVNQVQKGLLVDPAGTLRTVLGTANGLGPQRLPVLSALVGPGLVAEASQVATAMALAQRTVGVVR